MIDKAWLIAVVAAGLIAVAVAAPALHQNNFIPIIGVKLLKPDPHKVLNVNPGDKVVFVMQGIRIDINGSRPLKGLKIELWLEELNAYGGYYKLRKIGECRTGDDGKCSVTWVVDVTVPADKPSITRFIGIESDAGNIFMNVRVPGYDAGDLPVVIHNPSYASTTTTPTSTTTTTTSTSALPGVGTPTPTTSTPESTPQATTTTTATPPPPITAPINPSPPNAPNPLDVVQAIINWFKSVFHW